jgi:hypothetical protein
MIIDALEILFSEMQLHFTIAAGSRVTCVCFTPPGHLVLSFKRPDTQYMSTVHSLMISKVFKKYPLLDNLVIPQIVTAKWFPFRGVSTLDIKTPSTLVYWCDEKSWDCWQSWS